MTREDRIIGLISLDEKINSELFHFENNINEISQLVSTDEGHTQYLSRISYIQSLFDRASDIIREISFTDADTNLFEALQAKDRIATNYVRFSRMQNQIEQVLNKNRQSEADFITREIASGPEAGDEPIEEEEVLPAETEENVDDLLLEEELLAEEETEAKKKKANKKKADAAGRKALSDAEQQQFRENERHYQETQRQMELDRQRAEMDTKYQSTDYEKRTDSSFDDSLPKENENNPFQSLHTEKTYDTPNSTDYPTDHPTDRPEKPVTAADLRDAQYREEEKREAEREQARARRQETHDKFLAYQEAHRSSDIQPSTDVPQSHTPSFTEPDDYSSKPRPEKPVTAADLRDAQYREEEKREAEREQARARKQEVHDKFTAYQDAQRPGDKASTDPSSQREPSRYTMPDNRSSVSPDKAAPGISSEVHYDREPERVSVPSHKSQNPHFQTNDLPQQSAYAFVPSGIAHVNLSTPQSKARPSNGSFQGVSVGSNIKGSSPEKVTFHSTGSNLKSSSSEKATFPSTGPDLKGSSYGKASSSRTNLKTTDRKPTEKTPSIPRQPQRGAASKTERPRTEVTQFGYTPTGVFAHTAVDGVLGRKHTTLKASSAVGQPLVKGSGVRNNTRIRNQEPRRPYEPVWGTTGQTKRENVSKIRKNTVKEPSSGLNKKSSHLRTRAIASSYAKAMGGRFARYAGSALSMGARKLYMMLQEGDDNALRGFETSRYYGMASVGALKAMSTRKLVQASVNKTFGKKVKLKNVGKELSSLRQMHSKAIQKKFGELNRLSDKTLVKEIKLLKNQGANLKGQIKALQSKGSALTSLERKKLGKLLKEHKALSLRLRKLIGLQKARLEVDKILKKANKVSKSALKNRRSIKNGLFALQRGLLSQLNKADEMGVQGIGKAINISTNRYVHKFIKHSFRVTWRVTKFSGRVAYKTARGVGKGVKKTVKATSKTIKNTRTLVKTGRKAGKTASQLAPKKIKTLPGKVTKKVLQKPHAAGVKNLFAKATASAKKAVKGIASFVKSAAGIKVIGAVLAFILLIVILNTVISSISGAAGSLVLSPDATEDGKLDLSAYHNVLLDEWNQYIADLNAQAEGEGADKIVVNMDTAPGNAKEILSMMAVRMCQDLDMDENDEIEPYLRYLTRKLNPFSKTVSSYQCSGCRSHWVDGNWQSYCDGHKMITFSVTALHFGPAEELNDPIFSADEMANTGQSGVAGGLIGSFEITYYCTEQYPHICNNGPPYKTATMTDVTPGRTIAVDPDVIPLGTHVIIDGHEYIAEDTGGAINSYRIDVAVDTHSEAMSKGTRYNVPVYNVDYEGEDIQSSGRWEGWNDGNRQWAKNIYYQDWTELYSGVNMLGGGSYSTDLSGVTFVNGSRPGNQQIVNIGKSQEGYQEGYKFYSWYGFPNHVPWCATFVSWCANQAGVADKVGKFAYCPYWASDFRSKGQWARPGDITPVAGDIIFFDWGGDGVTDHVGIVIGSDGSRVYTVEGNSSNMVKVKSYSLTYQGIYGYGIPNY